MDNFNWNLDVRWPSEIWSIKSFTVFIEPLITINITRKLYIYQIINILITIVRYLNYAMNINNEL